MVARLAGGMGMRVRILDMGWSKARIWHPGRRRGRRATG